LHPKFGEMMLIVSNNPLYVVTAETKKPMWPTNFEKFNFEISKKCIKNFKVRVP